MVCKITFCSEFNDIPDKAGRKTRRKTQVIAMHYAFHANAKNSTRLETIANVSTLDIV